MSEISRRRNAPGRPSSRSTNSGRQSGQKPARPARATHPASAKDVGCRTAGRPQPGKRPGASRGEKTAQQGSGPAVLSTETIENRQHGQRIVLLVEKAPDGKRASNRRLPPENAFTSAIRSFHDHSVHLVQKLPLPCGRFGERSGLVHIVA